MGKYQVVTDSFLGINRLEKTQNGEFKNCINVVSDEYPAIKCGVGCENVIHLDKKIIKAIPNIDSDADYTNFEGILEDTSFPHYGYVDGELKESLGYMSVNSKLFRISDMYYDINGLRAISSSSSISTYIFGGVATYIGTISYGATVDIIRFSYSQSIGLSINVGDVLALSISDEYSSSKNSSKRFDTYCKNEENATGYTIISITSSYIECRAVTNSGNVFKNGSIYQFTSSDNCMICKKYPSFTWLCQHLNRAAGVTDDGKSIMLSKPGKYAEFYDYSGEDTDSYCVKVASGGLFTGCISFDSILIAFKKNCIYGLYGDIPDNFQLVTISTDIGCIDPNSISACGGTLYFLSCNGFYKYSGGKPICISRKLNKRYKAAKACSDGRRYYAICTDENDNKELLCYDTEFNIWYSFSYIPNDIFSQNNKLYLVFDNDIKRLSNFDTEWVIESGNISENFFHDRAVVEMYVRARLKSEDAFINSYTAIDDDPFVPHITMSGKGYHEFYIPIRLHEGKSFRYKLEGTGECIITDIKRIYTTTEGGQ